MNRRNRIVLAALVLAIAGGCAKRSTQKSTGKGPVTAADRLGQTDQDLFREAMRQPDSALRAKVLETLLARQRDPEPRAFVLRHLVLAYAEAGDVAHMEGAAGQLELADDFPAAQVRNAIAYTYAEHGVKLNEARNLIMDALRAIDRIEANREVPEGAEVADAEFQNFIEENRGFFLDTLGWIDHRAGRETEAIAVLEEAAKRVDQSTVHFHLGEAYTRVGNVPKAAHAYARAVALASDDSDKASAALNELGKSGKVDAKALVKEAADALRKDAAQRLRDTPVRENVPSADPLHGRIDVVTPAFSIVDFTGKTLNNAALRGHVTVLDFWASWCGPCRLELPIYQDIFKKYQAKARFLAVTVDKKKADAERFLQGESFAFPVAHDPEGEVAGTFEVQGIPTIVVIDPCGEIAWIHQGFNPKIESILTQQIETLMLEQGKACATP